jgi:CBS domain-containing protein
VAGNQLVGMINDRLLVRDRIASPAPLRRRRVGELLDGPPPRVHPAETVRATAELMIAGQVDAVCVTDPALGLVGILTTADLVHVLAGRRPARRRPDYLAAAGPLLFRLSPLGLPAVSEPP